jgi:hypothetical protein
MASTTLTVTVNGGKAPLSILVNLYKDSGENPVLSITSSGTFTHIFDNLSVGSNYDLTIGGFNPSGGNTVCTITTDQIKLTPSSNNTPITNSGVSYRVDFNFNI